jgi:hypothetical protein
MGLAIILSALLLGGILGDLIWRWKEDKEDENYL